MFRLVVLSVLQSAFLCAGQVFLKLAVLRMQKGVGAWRFFVDSLLTNWWLLASGLAMTSAGLLWMYILRHFPLSQAYPLTAVSFVLGMLAGIFIFREQVSPLQWVGMACILVGCFFILGK